MSSASHWGVPPAPLLPQFLRHTYGTAPIPAWVARDLRLPGGSSYKKLDSTVWRHGLAGHPRLPKGIRNFLLTVTRQVLPEIGPTKIFADGWPEQVHTASLPWSVRARDALVFANCINDASALGAMTVERLLTMPGVGVRTILDFACAVEIMADSLDQPPTSSHASETTRAADEKSVPQTPETDFTDAVSSADALLKADIHDLPLSVRTFNCFMNAGVRTLKDISNKSDQELLRIKNFGLTSLNEVRHLLSNPTTVHSFLNSAEEPATPPEGFSILLLDTHLENIGLSVRTRNAFRNHDIQTFGDLVNMTATQLLQKKNFGRKSLNETIQMLESHGLRLNMRLDLESLRTQSAQNAGGPEAQDTQSDILESSQTILFDALDEAWMHEISSKDPRFSDLVPPGGTLFEQIDTITTDPASLPGDQIRLAQCIEQVTARMEELSTQPLEEALLNFLSAISRRTEQRLEVLADRLGWSGKLDIPTLQECGDLLKITRERFRQIEAETRERIPPHPVFMPQLDRAMAALNDAAPCSYSAAQDRLTELKICSRPFSPSHIDKIAEALGKEFYSHLDSSLQLIEASQYSQSSPVITAAVKLAGASGASNIQEVAAYVNASLASADFDERYVREVVTASPRFEFLTTDWFWSEKIRRNRLANVSKQMLSVNSPLTVATLRHGLRDKYAMRKNTLETQRLVKWPLVTPSQDVLEQFYAAHPDFNIDNNSNVTCTQVLDYRKELGTVEQGIVDYIRSTPNHLTDRLSLMKACLKEGLNESSLSVYLTYSTVTENISTDIWSLRGSKPSPAAVEAVRRSNALRPKEKSVLNYGWHSNGNLWIATRIRIPVGSFVFGPPHAVKAHLLDCSFEARDEHDIACGTVKCTDNFVFGMGMFLRRRGADEGDVLITEFDLANKTAILSLGNETTLETLDPSL